MSASAAPASTSRSIRTATPLITVGVTWLVRKAMMTAYESRTGKPAPVIHSREASFVSKVLWSATLATTIAIVEIVVFQVLDRNAAADA